MTGRLARLRRLEVKRPAPEGITVTITQQIVERGPDAEPVVCRTVRQTFTLYPQGQK
ncbi:hypothetical protein [Deinococcus sp.]|uniref:hypothetical protein n=1 Tax=Deinococcus sp. TaxID=47478 RepID=UPI003C7DC3FF